MAESEFAQLKERFDYLSERQSADHSGGELSRRQTR
jgi:hypothetical protein